MLKKEILQIMGGHTADGTPLTTAEQIAALPPEFIIKVFETNTRLSEDSGQKKAIADVVCRLLAADMSAEEIVMILQIKMEIVEEQAKHQKELIAQYAKQLKGRRQRAKKKQDTAVQNGAM